MPSFPSWLGAFILIVGVTACSRVHSVQQVASLDVELVTDYYAPGEYNSVFITLGEGKTRRAEESRKMRWAPEPGQDLSSGTVIASLVDLPLGQHSVEVSLVDAAENTVAKWQANVFLDGNNRVRLAIARGCQTEGCTNADGTMCELCIGNACASTQSLAVATLAGDESTDGTLKRIEKVTQAVCVNQFCQADSECGPVAECAEAKCVEGVCMHIIKPRGCQEPFYCNPTPGQGCVAPEGSLCGTLCVPEGEECRVGYWQCDGNTPMYCDDVNLWRAGTACSAGFCSGRGSCDTYITLDGVASNDLFGNHIALLDDLLFVHASNRQIGQFQGVTYVYQLQGDGSAALVDTWDANVIANNHLIEMIGSRDRIAFGKIPGLFTDPEVWVRRRQADGSWVTDGPLSDPNGGGLGGSARYGQPLAIVGDTLIVGDSDLDSANSRDGAAHVYTFDGSDWNHTQQLQASDTANNHHFGGAAAVEGSRLVVTSSKVNAATGAQSTAYVFEKVGSTWVEQHQVASTLSVNPNVTASNVALSGDYLALTSTALDGTGEVSLFQYDAGADLWIELQVIEGPTNARFVGTDLLVREPNSQGTGGESAAAVVYRFDGTQTWVLEKRLTGYSATPGTTYAGAAIDGNEKWVIIGAAGDNNREGGVYIFHRDW